MDLAHQAWTFFAYNASVAGCWNNKVLVTDGSGKLSPVSIGSAFK